MGKMIQLARGLGIAVASAGIGSRGWRRAAVACPVAVRLRRRDPRDGNPHVMIAGEIERRRVRSRHASARGRARAASADSRAGRKTREDLGKVFH